MFATGASCSIDDLVSRPLELYWDFQLPAAAVVKDHHYHTTELVAVIVPLCSQRAVSAMEQYGVVQQGTRILICGLQVMAGDEQIALLPMTERLNANQTGRQHDRVQAIYAHGVDPFKPGKTVTFCIGKAAIHTQTRYSAARFDAAEEVTLRQMLMFNGHCWPAMDAGAFQRSQQGLSNLQSARRRNLFMAQLTGGMLFHGYLTTRVRIGQPKASRIMSLVQPAQQ